MVCMRLGDGGSPLIVRMLQPFDDLWFSPRVGNRLGLGSLVDAVSSALAVHHSPFRENLLVVACANTWPA